MNAQRGETKEQQLVVVRLDRERYGVPIEHVHEIIRMQEVTRIPRAPSFVEGVINLRGQVIPVIDLRRRFGLAAGERNGASRIVVVEMNGSRVGMVVDAVLEVMRLPDSAVVPPEELLAASEVAFLRGVAKQGDDLILLLDLQRVLEVHEQRELAELQTA
ncbi:MAG: chemotaxis protein CheW [Armatimonadota bacterium]|nr:chemotaxis protein CheW [Armatimonadota bacterium]MDR7396640.1 chemotaxis protein CheW [Armatimonadota bacterium]MDR7399059.1 chemotaxis protein CheW [Armatimonadota bacterium]MDR7405797.1 chemotaxis protein CheW [Armatimonadota bacterium]MDR7599468.1 chemotaxis protein CheW [Armatimonadota bacterium]